jgi:hypothetical protein
MTPVAAVTDAAVPRLLSPLVTGLIDHAPTFPPAALDTVPALAAHRAAHQSSDRGALACLVWPSEQLPRLTATGGPGREDSWVVSAVAPRLEDRPPRDWLQTVRTTASMGAVPGVDLRAVELLMPDLGGSAADFDAAVTALTRAIESRTGDYRIVLELPLPGAGRQAGVEAVAAAVAATAAPGRLLLKVRTGATGLGAAPSVEVSRPSSRRRRQPGRRSRPPQVCTTRCRPRRAVRPPSTA